MNTNKEWEEEAQKFYGTMFESGDFDELIAFISKVISQAVETERERIIKLVEEIGGSYLIQNSGKGDSEIVKVSLDSRKRTIQTILSALKNK